MAKILQTTRTLLFATAVLLPTAGSAAEPVALPGTALLTGDLDYSVAMRDRFRTYLQGEIDRSIDGRAAHWSRDFSSPEAYDRSIEPNRARLRKMIGVVDARVPFPAPELIATVDRSSVIAETERYSIRAVKWPVFAGVWAEGLMLEPKASAVAAVIALPDADQSPEAIAGLGLADAKGAFAAHLAAAGCRVLVPTLIDRTDEFSGRPDVATTNQPHREWIWRQAYEMGRHLIGYEVQKVLAAVDWLRRPGATLPVGVVGYGEGGLVALYSSALDPRIEASLVSGYFDSRQNIADEPIYRDVLGLLTEFGDAEIGSMIVPRSLVIECSAVDPVDGPPAPRAGRRVSGAPGRIRTPPVARVRAEVERLRAFFAGQSKIIPRVEVFADGELPVAQAGSEPALSALLQHLGVARTDLLAEWRAPETAAEFDTGATRERQRRQVEQLVEFTQRLMRNSAAVRERLWAGAAPKSATTWPAATAELRSQMWDNLVGRYRFSLTEPSARTRRIAEATAFTTYEVLLDVSPDLFAWGYLLLPNSLRPGEKRPVVVCQHGLEGVPADVLNDDPSSRAYQVYQGFATRLAERGFIVYAPHNFYRGGNEFRQLQRLAHPMKQTLFALTTAQHEQLLRWLSSLDSVDPQRIGFYGLSYGGNTAVRVPALLTQYAVVIASGDFNEWVFKNVTVDHVHSMMYNNVYEVYEFDLGHTFNHAEMAALIAPRPFMVERGHDDGVARDEWVAAEYAKVRRLYAKLGIPERTTIEFFNGPHRIHGAGTYEFLHRHLRWPAPAN